MGLSILPRPDGFSQKPGENHSALHLPQISISAKDYFHFFPDGEKYSFKKFKKYSWQTEKSCDNPSSASVSNLNSHERLFPFPPPPSFTSHFLFLPDPWYLLRCRWMVGNSDGSVIETYSPDPAAGGDNNKISISANFHQSDRCLCRPNGPLGVRISDMKYSSRPQI